ncbi:hypothetical protein DAPPUDRAFT_246745 [Daphnia pulex]|uniref:Uncharacterized protein n=1 Tax=Daphnia pulex TaxID=6669 RepID=E9GR54_DAPPU|nr:hypothetical protein DAPPUDRAFT_246745 [Daphnia pulex]|eukprot:EFX78051.1 hypothetical protein DAPPUDRAFT_246745 [Daphnia pulex]
MAAFEGERKHLRIHQTEPVVLTFSSRGEDHPVGRVQPTTSFRSPESRKRQSSPANDIVRQTRC